MVDARRGHSLPELIVAVTFLALALGGVAASSVLGARWTTEALRAQEGTRLAEAVLDSLARLPTPTSGSREQGPWRIRWTTASTGWIAVTVETAEGVVLKLEGRRVPAVPVLPDQPPAGEDP